MAKTCVNFTAAQVLAALRGEVVTVREAVKADLGGLIWCGWILDSTMFNDRGKACWVDQYPLSTREVRVSPPYVAGNTLWVRETWAVRRDLPTKLGWEPHCIVELANYRDAPASNDFGKFVTIYRANGDKIKREHGDKWRPSNQMPHWASRLNVTVQSVAVEQVASGWEWVAETVKAVQE